MTERLPMGLSAHLGYLFLDLPLRDRFVAAKDAGFDAVEHPQPFELTASEMSTFLGDNGLGFAQMAAAVGDGSKGEKGLAALPGREADFVDGFQRSIDYAEAIGCPLVHPMAGVPPADEATDRVAATYSANIEKAIEMVKGRPVRLLVEAISHAAVPGYHMHKLADAFALSRSHDDGAVSVLLDTFHARTNAEDAIALVMANADRIGHIHIADHPGRHEPGTGAFEFGPFLDQLKRCGYAGYLGFEYVPSASTAAGLHWVPSWRRLSERTDTNNTHRDRTSS